MIGVTNGEADKLSVTPIEWFITSRTDHPGTVTQAIAAKL